MLGNAGEDTTAVQLVCCPLSTAMAVHVDGAAGSSFKFHYTFDYLTVIASVLLLKHLLQMAVRKSSALEEEVSHYAPRTLRRLLPTASFYHPTAPEEGEEERQDKRPVSITKSSAGQQRDKEWLAPFTS